MIENQKDLFQTKLKIQIFQDTKKTVATQGMKTNYRFPPTRGAAFCCGFAAFCLDFSTLAAVLAGTVAFFTALVAFFCSLAARTACSLWALRTY